MSSPSQPPQSGQPKILPMGETNKPGGADRVPQSTDIPQPNRGAAQLRAALRMGVSPDTLKMRPGYQPPPTRGPMMASDTADYSRPNSAPQQAAAPARQAAATPMPPVRTLPKPAPEGSPVPMPRPRPAGADASEFPTNRGMPLIRSLSPQADALTQALEGRMDYGMMRREQDESGFPKNMPKAGQQYDPTTGNVASNAVSGTRGLSGLSDFERGKVMLAQAIADGMQYPRIAQPGEAPKEAMKGDGGKIPPPQGATRGATLPPQAASAPQKFTPTQQSDVYYQPDPNAEMEKGKKGKDGKPKDVKLKSNKDAKDSSLYYYRVLGAEPGDKHAADTALRQLQKRAIEEPWTLTRDEDAILAAAAKTTAFHKSMEPDAVQQRFQEYAKKKDSTETFTEQQKQGGSSGFTRPRTADPAEAVVKQMFSTAGQPSWQGIKLPTQQDVSAGAQAPAQFKQRFPDYQPPQQQAPAELDVEPPDTEE